MMRRNNNTNHDDDDDDGANADANAIDDGVQLHLQCFQ
jgi:hypothetical protein